MITIKDIFPERKGNFITIDNNDIEIKTVDDTTFIKIIDSEGYNYVEEFDSHNNKAQIEYLREQIETLIREKISYLNDLLIEGGF